MSKKSLEENIKKFGWQCQYVFDPNSEREDFSYSIGFEESYGHPEIMIFGLKKETMHSVLSDIADEIKNGKVFEPNKKTLGVLSGDYEVIFKPLLDSYLSEYAGIASDYYSSQFRVYIMLWPDKNNVLPTDNNCELTVQNEALKIV